MISTSARAAAACPSAAVSAFNPVHEVDGEIGVAHRREHVVVVVSGAGRHDGDVRCRYTLGQQRPHPAESLSDLMKLICAGEDLRLWMGRRRRHHLDFRALQPIRHMPRTGDPRHRNGPRKRDQEGPPARRHLAVDMDLQGTDYGRRMPNPSQRHLNQIARTLHRCRQALDDRVLERRQCVGSRMADVRQINSGTPGLVERGADGRRHSRQILDRPRARPSRCPEARRWRLP